MWLLVISVMVSMLDDWFIFMWVVKLGLMNLFMLKVVDSMLGFFLISSSRCLMLGNVVDVLIGMMVLFLVMLGVVMVMFLFLIGVLVFRVFIRLGMVLVLKVVVG